MQRGPPRRAAHSSRWPPDEFGATGKLSDHEVKCRLRDIALTHDVPEGWKTFAARARSYTSQKDFLHYIWWEKSPDDLFLRPIIRPTCPSARTFLWWLGRFFQPNHQSGFVSGFFAGGHQRLSNTNLEIQPSIAWNSGLGWSQCPRDPLVWLSNGQIVARYERIHGPLRETPHGPNHRHPVVDRWLVTNQAFEHVQRVIGNLRLREDFEAHQFSDE